MNYKKRKTSTTPKLHAGIDNTEDESNDSELDMSIDVDEQGEKELCGSFNKREEQDYADNIQDSSSDQEEEEVGSDGNTTNSEDEEEEIQSCISTRNIENMKRMVQCREDQCKRLQKEAHKEKLHEKQDKEMKLLLDKLKKANKTKKLLQQSIANSRRNSPMNSPRAKKSSDKDSGGKQKRNDRRIVRKTHTRSCHPRNKKVSMTMFYTLC